MSKLLGLVLFFGFIGFAHADCENAMVRPITTPLEEIAELPKTSQPIWASTLPTLKIYAPEQLSTENQAVIIPPTGGENFLDRTLARSLCKSGIYTLILDYQSAVPSMTTDLSVHDEGFEEGVAQLENALRFSPKPTVLVGSSLGALIGSAAYGLAIHNGVVPNYELSFHPTQIVALLKGASLTVSGGPLPQVLSQSKLGPVAAQRKLWTSSESMNEEQYQSALENAERIDTVGLADTAYSKNILFFEALLDDWVPTHTQSQLWHAWGKPKRERYLLGHAETIFAVYEFRANKIRDFIKKLK